MARIAKIPKDIPIGSVHDTNNNGKLIVTSYKNNLNVGVRFIDTGFESVVNVSQIRKGTVKDNLKPLVFGVGYFGIGDHPALANGKPTKAYNTWRHMLGRCYDEAYQSNYPTYKGCSVCIEWHSFQSFAEWFNKIPEIHTGKCYLDKDLKYINNKLYSPDTCLIVSSAVNGFLTDRVNDRGLYMIGVGWHSRDMVFTSNCNDPVNSKQVHLGYFSSEILAHKAWRSFKSNAAVSLSQCQSNQDIRDGLIRYAKAMDNYEIYADGYTK